MNRREQLERVKRYVEQIFNKDATGHDFEHMERVAVWSRNLAKIEGADPYLCELAGWLHDIGDSKLFEAPEEAVEELKEMLGELGLSNEDCHEVMSAIDTVSFSKGKQPISLTGKVVQDADRLDAIGAVGIARTFAYGGAKGQSMYKRDPDIPSSYQHFYDKIVKLSSRMNTSAGKREAEHRHQFLLNYLEEFKREQNCSNEQEEKR
ncbi:HD domain-containing protein [Halobacillus yeomjeoni]|uniref:HD domain-containing protein n=1 Tax=Halobacillus yeomjeoni TaxID=311194 RepID=A0A931HTI4_9BACI|nr:HD domain-containing protein [Halobacillus yeomjeoni]MBH0229517.1 HD domain-containing protein [Halobacillus yeomjeoni]